MNVKEFNERYEVGSEFIYHSIPGKSNPVCVKTTSIAREENDQAVVSVEGKKGTLLVESMQECKTTKD